MSETTKPIVHTDASSASPAPNGPDLRPDLRVTPLPSQIAGFVTAGHAVLFTDTDSNRCDVCADSVQADGDDDDESGFDVRGRGLLVWSRGDERRYQEPPLCAACAAAIGVSALQRWEIEEEEG